jgi:diguanylate cyclase (GGDEF)-like protein
MADDIRYSEFQFLRAVENRSIETFNVSDGTQAKAVGLSLGAYTEMVETLLEELSIKFEQDEHQLLVWRFRGELFGNQVKPMTTHEPLWNNPREALFQLLIAARYPRIRITYRGSRRIEELRDVLRRDRILDDFGVLLSMRYFRRDLEDALRRSADVSVTVIYSDMDHFKRINTSHGQMAGDVVMKAYLDVIRDKLGLLGEGYRGVGDEVAALLIGQEHQSALALADSIRAGVEYLRCDYKGTPLPLVTVSIGVATTPPESRGMEIEQIAEDRKRVSKETGRNRVVGKPSG